MLPETQSNLEYFRQLHAQYNRYMGKYFGFTMKQIAEFMGLKKSTFSDIIKGQRNLTDEHEQAFNRAFEEFKIYEKTRDFKETAQQRSLRDYWKAQKKA